MDVDGGLNDPVEEHGSPGAKHAHVEREGEEIGHREAAEHHGCHGNVHGEAGVADTPENDREHVARRPDKDMPRRQREDDDLCEMDRFRRELVHMEERWRS